jgi:hypothetical protein
LQKNEVKRRSQEMKALKRMLEPQEWGVTQLKYVHGVPPKQLALSTGLTEEEVLALQEAAVEKVKRLDPDLYDYMRWFVGSGEVEGWVMGMSGYVPRRVSDKRKSKPPRKFYRKKKTLKEKLADLNA